MKKTILYLLIFILLLSAFQGLFTSATNVKETDASREYTHTVLVEVATAQSCKPCHYWNQNILDIYNSGDYDFHYVEMIVFDYNDEVLNEEARDWHLYYHAGSIPKNIMDGDYRRIANNSEVFIQYLNECGNRNVAEITASMTAKWLGNATIQVDLIVENNGASDYNGHIRASITEIVSRYNTYYGEPYHYGFIGFAFDMDISIPARGTFKDSTTWNGNEHEDNHGNNFGNIVPENIQLTMGVLNNNDGYVDETAISYVDTNNPPNTPGNPNPADGAEEVDININLSWECSDPDGDLLTYDIYFGTNIPPPPVKRNHQTNNYNPGTLLYNKTYYWNIVAIDSPGDSTSGPIWSFNSEVKTSENKPPKVEIIKPDRALFIKNIRIIPRIFRLALIIGKITVQAEATDEDSGINRVEFFVNNDLKKKDTTDPYSFDLKWNRPRLIHFFIIKAIAYDNEGKKDEDTIIVRKFL